MASMEEVLCRRSTVAGSDPVHVDAQVQDAIASGAYREALELVAQVYLDVVFAYCFRVFNEDTARAKDVTQQVFEEVCRGLARYRGESSVKTWLLAIAHHQCLKEIATGARHRSLLEQHQDDVATHLHDPPALAESAVLTQEGLARLAWALDQLAPEDRSILVMRFGIGVLHELSAPDIAQILGISRAAAYRRLQEALARLRRIMHDELG
jgi:RNA polymerase sigma-70 factor (ECF subfamily)